MTIAELFAKLTIKPDKRSFDAADKAIGFLKTALLGLVAIQTGRFFAGMVHDTTQLGGKIDDLAQSSGTAIKDLQELGYAGLQNASSLEGVATSLTKLSKNLFDATHGNKELAKSFSRAGIAIRNTDGTLRPAADVLMDIADHISSMPDGTKKTAVAMELLGKSGAELIPLLNSGSEGIQQLRDEAHELGAVMSDETVKSLAEFGDEQDRVKTALTGLRNEAVAALLPTLKEMVASLLAWVKANKELIKQKLVTVIKLLAGGLKIFAKGVGIVISILDVMGRHLDVVAVAVLALVTAIGLFKMASIAAAIQSGIAWAISVMPILLLAAAIAAVILIVEDLYNWFTGGESVLKDLWEAASQYLNWDTIAEKIKAAFTEALEWVKRKAVEAWEAITGSVDFDKAARHVARQAHTAGEISGEELRRTEKFGFGGPSIMEAAEDRFQQIAVPQIDIPASESAGGAVFAPNVQITGAGGTPEETARAVATALDDYWSSQMKKAAATGGVR